MEGSIRISDEIENFDSLNNLEIHTTEYESVMEDTSMETTGTYDPSHGRRFLYSVTRMNLHN